MSLSQLDANQVIKSVYDANTQSLKTTAAFVPSTSLLSAIPAGTSALSAAINILPYKVTGVMVSWSGLNQLDATVQFEGSIDGTTYTLIGSPYTLASASGSQDFGLIDEPYSYIKLVYNRGTVTTGTVSAIYMQRA